MKLSKDQISAIQEEYNSWKESMYANRTLADRQDMGQFFTPPEITIQMIEKFDDLSGNILDPTCGAGNLLAACIKAGAKPDQIYGIELDPDILKIAKERLCNGLGVPEYHIHQGDALIDECYEFNENYNYEDIKRLQNTSKKINNKTSNEKDLWNI